MFGNADITVIRYKQPKSIANESMTPLSAKTDQFTPDQILPQEYIVSNFNKK